MLIVSELFNAAVNDLNAKKSVRYSRVLIVTELTVSGTQCILQVQNTFLTVTGTHFIFSLVRDFDYHVAETERRCYNYCIFIMNEFMALLLTIETRFYVQLDRNLLAIVCTFFMLIATGPSLTSMYLKRGIDYVKIICKILSREVKI